MSSPSTFYLSFVSSLCFLSLTFHSRMVFQCHALCFYMGSILIEQLPETKLCTAGVLKKTSITLPNTPYTEIYRQAM